MRLQCSLYLCGAPASGEIGPTELHRRERLPVVDVCPAPANMVEQGSHLDQDRKRAGPKGAGATMTSSP
jgi:hypothetical protein